jgi:hypothetical protein
MLIDHMPGWSVGIRSSPGSRVRGCSKVCREYPCHFMIRLGPQVGKLKPRAPTEQVRVAGTGFWAPHLTAVMILQRYPPSAPLGLRLSDSAPAQRGTGPRLKTQRPRKHEDLPVDHGSSLYFCLPPEIEPSGMGHRVGRACTTVHYVSCRVKTLVCDSTKVQELGTARQPLPRYSWHAVLRGLACSWLTLREAASANRLGALWESVWGWSWGCGDIGPIRIKVT